MIFPNYRWSCQRKLHWFVGFFFNETIFDEAQNRGWMISLKQNFENFGRREVQDGHGFCSPFLLTRAKPMIMGKTNVKSPLFFMFFYIDPHSSLLNHGSKDTIQCQHLMTPKFSQLGWNMFQPLKSKLFFTFSHVQQTSKSLTLAPGAVDGGWRCPGHRIPTCGAWRFWKSGENFNSWMVDFMIHGMVPHNGWFTVENPIKAIARWSISWIFPLT